MLGFRSAIARCVKIDPRSSSHSVGAKWYWVYIHRQVNSQTRQFSSSPTRNMKVLAILYSGGAAAKQEPRLLGTVENEVCSDFTVSLGEDDAKPHLARHP